MCKNISPNISPVLRHPDESHTLYKYVQFTGPGEKKPTPLSSHAMKTHDSLLSQKSL